MRPEVEPRATVIVPSCNDGPFLASAVDSALAQTEQRVEVLVVDDGSSDDGPAMLARLDDPRVRVLCQPRRGLARTLNLALGLARAPWVAVLPPRHVLAPGCVEAQLAAASANPPPGAVFVLPELVDPAGEPLDDPRATALYDPGERSDDQIVRALLERNFLCFAGALFDRELALRAGGFDPSLRKALDHDLWLRILPRRRALILSQRLVKVAGHPSATGGADHASAQHEHAYAVTRALSSLRLEDWFPGLRDVTDGDRTRERDAWLELSRLVLRSGLLELRGFAAELAARAYALGAQPAPRDAFEALRSDLPGLGAPAATEHSLAVASISIPSTVFARRGAAPKRASGLRIALEVTTLDRGGLETVVARLALGLRDAGHEPLVVCTDGGGEVANALRRNGIEVVELRIPDRPGDMACLLEQRDIQLLNPHFSTFGTRIAATVGIPVIATLHNAYAWLGSGVFDEIRAVDPSIAGYVAVSQSVADFCVRRFALDPARIVVIRNSVDGHRPAVGGEERAAARRELGIPHDAKLLVQIGRIDPIKCQLALVEAVRLLAPSRPDLRTWLVGGVGNPAYAHRVAEHIRAAGLEERIEAVGERNDVARILAAADVFVMPSVLEGLSLAAIEAMAAGVPAVLTRTGDAEFLLGGEPLPGAIVEGPAFAPHVDSKGLNQLAASEAPPHAGALATAIAEVLDDLPRRAKLARDRARELAAVLSPQAYLESHLELFTAVAAAGSARRTRAFARATRRREAERRELRSSHAPLGQALDDLSRVLAGNLANQRAAWSIESGRADLAAASMAFAEASSTLGRSLDKLRIVHRLGSALRAMGRRFPLGPSS